MPKQSNELNPNKKNSYYCPGCYSMMFGSSNLEFDCRKCNLLFKPLPQKKGEIVDYMNKQHALIEQLKKEIAYLTHMIRGLDDNSPF